MWCIAALDATAKPAIGPNTALRLLRCGTTASTSAAYQLQSYSGSQASEWHEWRSTAAGSSAASACLLVASALQAASPADLVPEPPHASRGMRRRLATRCRGPFNGGMPHQELALNKHTQACAAIKPPKPPSEEELRVRLSRRSGAKHVQRAAAGVAAAYKPTSSAIRHSARCAPSRWPSP